MSDTDIKVSIRAEELGLSLENLAEALEAEFSQAIADLAHATYAKIVASAQEKLNSTSQDYLEGLSFEKLGDNQYVISLDGKFPDALEGGSPAYDMRNTLLNSTSNVSAGSRTGQPWVQISKKGKKFAHVPFKHSPGGSGGATDLAGALKGMEALNQATGRKQRLTKLFKDSSGNPLLGRVASVAEAPKGFPNLAGVVKYQKAIHNEKTGKSRITSTYLTFRTISENGRSWMQPQKEGLHAFQEAEEFIHGELDRILNYYLQ